MSPVDLFEPTTRVAGVLGGMNENSPNHQEQEITPGDVYQPSDRRRINRLIRVEQVGHDGVRVQRLKGLFWRRSDRPITTGHLRRYRRVAAALDDFMAAEVRHLTLMIGHTIVAPGAGWWAIVRSVCDGEVVLEFPGPMGGPGGPTHLTTGVELLERLHVIYPFIYVGNVVVLDGNECTCRAVDYLRDGSVVAVFDEEVSVLAPSFTLAAIVASQPR